MDMGNNNSTAAAIKNAKTLGHVARHGHGAVHPNDVAYDREIRKSDLPREASFDVPGRNAGQSVEVAYGRPSAYRFGCDVGDPFMRVTDRSEPVGQQVRYYVRTA